MKAKKETIGMYEFTKGILKGQFIVIGKKMYYYIGVATMPTECNYHFDKYYIVQDLKINIKIALDSNTLIDRVI